MLFFRLRMGVVPPEKYGDSRRKGVRLRGGVTGKLLSPCDALRDRDCCHGEEEEEEA
jgi:hypothetical protein